MGYSGVVRWPFRPRRERGHSLAVSCQAVEPPVHCPLQAAARQIEQHRRRQGGRRPTATGAARDANTWVASRTSPTYATVSSTGHQCRTSIVVLNYGRDRSGNVTAPAANAPPRGAPITNWARGDHPHVTLAMRGSRAKCGYNGSGEGTTAASPVVYKTDAGPMALGARHLSSLTRTRRARDRASSPGSG